MMHRIEKAIGTIDTARQYYLAKQFRALETAITTDFELLSTKSVNSLESIKTKRKPS